MIGSMADKRTLTRIRGLYEYVGIQRCGKSTCMVKDLVIKILPSGIFKPEDVWANFRVFIDGVHCVSTDELVETILKFKRDKVRDKVILFDEVGQFLLARGYMDKRQTEVVSFGWQMPKRNIIMLFASNVGNSADVILRDCAWLSIMPKFHLGVEREDDYIECAVIWNYDCVTRRGLIIPEIWKYQLMFDSYEAIE